MLQKVISEERLEENLVKFTIEIAKEEYEKATNRVYSKNKRKYEVAGYRLGKAPKAIIEMMYGKEVFLEDTVNELVPEAIEDFVRQMDRFYACDQASVTAADPYTGVIVYEVEVAYKPKAIIGQYKGLHHKMNLEISDAEVNEHIQKLREKNAEWIEVSREVRLGDEVCLDFEGFVDDVAFEGGKAENYPLVVGSHSFIVGFEEQLVGKECEKSFSIDVTFPSDYHETSLAGKPATFKCFIHSIKEKVLPEVNDEFAKLVDEESLEKLIKSSKKILVEERTKKEKERMEDELVSKIASEAKVSIPEIIIQKSIDNMVGDFENQLQASGLTLEQYTQFTGIDEKLLREQSRDSAIQSLRNSFVLDAIAEKEGCLPTEGEMEKEYEALGAQYGLDVENVKRIVPLEAINDELSRRKAMEIIINNAILD